MSEAARSTRCTRSAGLWPAAVAEACGRMQGDTWAGSRCGAVYSMSDDMLVAMSTDEAWSTVDMSVVEVVRVGSLQ